MPAIHIRDIPETVLAALKRRAANNSRSLQGEIRHQLLLLAQESIDANPHPLPGLELTMSKAPDGQNWSRSEIYGD